MSAKKEYIFDPARNPMVRDDYRPSSYKIDTVDLRIDLDLTATVVTSYLDIERNPKSDVKGGALVLDGERQKLKRLEISLRGQSYFSALDPAEYVVTDKNLILLNPPAEPFTLCVVSENNPSENTTLMGLYDSEGILATQCEAQGFRNITYYLDRPDNLAVFNVTLTADKQKYPILLSNGNGINFGKSRDHGDGTHSVTWFDPHPKPSYLFAAVAGDMAVLEDEFITMSGKKVDLRIFVPHQYKDKVQWGMESIKRAMKWDEDRYGREYDLDCFHIVGVDKFNMGAMENKGLNVFNVATLVGSPATSTDDELTYIERVIAHEYFHNWTGDRITCRDWFELTLKEGLTVLRDRQFTGDMHSEAIKRIDDAMIMRTRQFDEDAGAMSHPIRPDMVEEFDNIYSSTVYDKGSHVLGMLHTMLGEKTWRAAMDNYFERFDGQAITCDDFMDNMESFSPISLHQFRKWYGQSGTPEISYKGEYNAEKKTYRLTITQETKPTADQKDKVPLHIPVSIGLINESGKDIPLQFADEAAGHGPSRILHVTAATQTFEFINVDGPVIPSILRNFSAPVKVVTPATDDELMFRMVHDSDPYNKYEATQGMMIKTVRGLVQDLKDGKTLQVSANIATAYGFNVANALDGDLAFSARLLEMPSYTICTQGQKDVEPDLYVQSIDFLKQELARIYETDLAKIYQATEAPADEAYALIPQQVGRRELHNLSLDMLAPLHNDYIIASCKQHAVSKNMTEILSALRSVSDNSAADKMLEEFYNLYKDDNNVIDNWLTLQATMTSGDPLTRVKQLMQHPAYDETNPNKMRAVVLGFMRGNPGAFHKKDGSGYAFAADTIIHMNSVNPDATARIAGEFSKLNMYDKGRQALMIAQMTRIMQTPNLANGIKEIIGKTLDNADKALLKQATKTFSAAATNPKK